MAMGGGIGGRGRGGALAARRLAGLALAAAVCACDRRDAPAPDAQGPGVPGPESGAPAHAASTRTPSVPARPSSAPASPSGLARASASGVVPAVSSTGKAAPSSCRVLRGPIELPFRGPAALVPHGDVVDAVSNDDGHPRVTSFAAIAPSAAAVREPLEAGAASGSRVPCAVAGTTAFCSDRSGAVHRSTLAGTEERVVASSRMGTRIAAREVGGKSAFAYLASRKTSEGWVSEAWVGVDDQLPQRLSEDGSGATAVTLASRGSSLVGLSIDARAALTAMHARLVTYDAQTHALGLGEDAVVFVGGPGERRTSAALVFPAVGPGWALLPIAKDVADFGLALVRLDDPPRVDEPVSWSMYPNGLDPSPVAAACDGKRFWVARVRPREVAPGSPRVLELGEVPPDDREAGAPFAVRQVVTTVDSAGLGRDLGEPSDATLAVDSRGSLWVGWVDLGGSWLEELSCR